LRHGQRQLHGVCDAGHTCTQTLSGLADGETYFFAVCAYDATGIDGELSAEISFSIPRSLGWRFGLFRVNGFCSGGTVRPGGAYQILVTETLSDWSVVHQVTAGEDGAFEYRFFNDPSSSARFYRLQALEL
jgi:hypothetical protein